MRGDRTTPARLREAIEAYRAAHKDRLDQEALKLLARLAASSGAAEAFERLKTEDRAAARILTTCIESDQLARTFSRRIRAEQNMLVRLDRLDKAIVDLRSFFEKNAIAQGSVVEQELWRTSDRLSAAILYDPSDIAAMKRGLYLFANLITARRRVATETVLRLGATRKRQIERAGENAAIGWLAEGVRRVTGKAHLAAVADLAQVILATELSEDRVRNAVRTREREWREPLSPKPAHSPAKKRLNTP